MKKKLPEIHLDDDDFFERLQARDEAAWLTLIRGFKSQLQNVIRSALIRAGLSFDHVEDIEQQTWITAFSKCHEVQFQDMRHLFNWLNRIQKNHVLNLSRKPDAMSLDDDTREAALVEVTPADSDARPVETQVIAAESRDARRRQFYSAFALVLEEQSSPVAQQIIVRRLLYQEDAALLAAEFEIPIREVYDLTYAAKQKLVSYVSASSFFTHVAKTRIKGVRK